MPDVDPIVQALMGVRQYPTDDPIAGIQPPLQTPKLGMTPPPVNAAPQPNQVLSGVGDLTGVNDAVRALRGQMTPEEQQAFAATAAFGLIPGAGELRPVAKAAEELAPPLYSAAAKAVQDARLTKGTPEQWLGYLRNQPGVKQEELTTMGALPAGKDLLTKDEMQQWANANQVQLKEVMKGSGGGDRLTPDSSQFDPDRLQLTSDTKFNDPKLTLPGGQNYREMLMTMSQEQSPEAAAITAKMNDGTATDTDLRRLDQIRPTNFTSSHWDEPNVLAHARMNDRTIPDAQGNPQKTLFLEEIQSDWHQAGRKQGYQGSSPDYGLKIVQSQENPDHYLIQGPNGEAVGGPYANQQLAQRGVQDFAGLQGNKAVPDAPFKQTWPDLMLKRLVRHAAENGYDQLAWTPGDVQADRYDLSKHLDSLQYYKDGDNYNLAGMKNGQMLMSRGGITPNDLPNHVGKDLAEKIVSDSGKPIVENSPIKEFTSPDLKVGGEGMRAFYDKMLVDKANAIGKKYGAKVTQQDISSTAMPSSFSREQWEQLPAQWRQENGGVNPNAKAWVLPIVPELKRAALTKGFPMFAAGGLTAGGLAAGQEANDPNTQMLSALRGSPPTPQQ